MSNTVILHELEQQRDNLYNTLSKTNVSARCREMYDQIKKGEMIVFDNQKEEMLSGLEEFMEDNSFDTMYADKLELYRALDAEELTTYFIEELRRLFSAMKQTGKENEMQAVFIEYDDYGNPDSYIKVLSEQPYPLVTQPRYIYDEVDHTKVVWETPNAINFEPAWPDCTDLEDIEYVDELIFEVQNLFQLNSRVLLHKALLHLDSAGELSFLKRRPFTFYINEHDTEVMTLYRLV